MAAMESKIGRKKYQSYARPTFAFETLLNIIAMLQFYHCPICGNVVIKVVDGGTVPSCCGKEMELMIPKKHESYSDKHLPVVERCDHYTYEVNVGSVPHPMTEDHFIKFICVQTDGEIMIRHLSPGDDPGCLSVCEERPEAVYAYCNKHGLWEADGFKEGGSIENKKCKR